MTARGVFDVVFTGYCWGCDAHVQVVDHDGEMPEGSPRTVACPMCGADVDCGWYTAPPVAAAAPGATLPLDVIEAAIRQAIAAEQPRWAPSVPTTSAQIAVRVIHDLTVQGQPAPEQGEPT